MNGRLGRDMAAGSGRVFEVQASLTQEDGGLLRVLIDAERFGLAVQTLTLRPSARDEATQLLAATFLASTSALNAAQLAARLSRHVGVMCGECLENAAAPSEQALAA